MNARAVLLIDLENFYISREKLAPPYGPDKFAADLEHLLTFAREAAGAGTPTERPLIVRRAYANFNARRPKAGAGYGLDYFLQRIPDVLLDQGVEPVQVFQLSRGGIKAKNAADMRMAMDATALLGTAAGIEQFVLVTGDADFIPVILELKRHGRDVAVIGVRGATSQHLQRFVDSFDFFEDLLAAGEVTGAFGDGTAAGPTIADIAGALARLLTRTRPIKFAAVKPLLTRELNRPFDPLDFGNDSTGDFLRKHAAELRIEVRQGLHDWEIDRVAGVAAPPVKAAPTPAAAAVAKPPEPLPTPAEPAAWHTPEQYAKVLKQPGPVGSPVPGKTLSIRVVPWESAVRIGTALYARLGPGATGPTDWIAVRAYLNGDPTAAADPNHVQNVNAMTFLLRLYGRTLDDNGRMALADGIESGEHLAICLVHDQLDLLSQRLAHHGATAPEPAAFAELLRSGPAGDDDLVGLTTRLLAQLAGTDAEPPAEEPAAETPPVTEAPAEAPPPEVPVDAPPVEAPVVEAPVSEAPVDAPPVSEAPPADAPPPVEAPPVDEIPVAEDIPFADPAPPADGVGEPVEPPAERPPDHA